MSAETVHGMLDEQGIDYEIHEHPRAVDAQRLAAAEGVSGWEVAKPVLVSVAGELAMMVVPGATMLDLERASDSLGHNEVRLATEDEFVSVFPDCEPGAEPPFGNLYGLPVFVDQRLREQRTVLCRDGSHTQTLRLATEDYLHVLGAEILDLAVAPAAHAG